MRTKLAIGAALLAGIAPNLMSAQSKNEAEQRWIDSLKATPVARIETGMPEKPLGEWLVANAKGTEVRYAVESCEDFADAKPKLSNSNRCVMVTLLRGWVVLNFAVTGPEKSGDAGPVQCRYLIGREGPSPDSSMKRPTRVIFKLSDLRTMLGWE